VSATSNGHDLHPPVDVLLRLLVGLSVLQEIQVLALCRQGGPSGIALQCDGLLDLKGGQIHEAQRFTSWRDRVSSGFWER